MIALCSLAAAAPAGAADAVSADRATFEIRLHGSVIGVETVEFQNAGDSLRVFSETLQIGGRAHTDSLMKRLQMVFTPDFDLRGYDSSERLRGRTSAVGWTPNDTLFTLYRQHDGRGTGDTYARPPGRLFVLEQGVFASFEVICRMLGGKSFLTRPLNLLVIGTPDTLLTASLADHGPETISWGSRPVTARRLTLGEGPGSYHFWMGPGGRLLRLEHEPTGLRIERIAPPVKRKPAPAPH